MAIAFVNEDHNPSNSGSASTVATPSGIDCTSGNFIAVWVTWLDAGVTISSVTDTKGNTYTGKTKRTDTTLAGQWWYAFNVGTQLANVVTANFSAGATFRSISALQYSGILTTDPFDTEAGGSGSTTDASTSALTLAGTGDLMLLGACKQTGATSAGTNITTIRENFDYAAVGDNLSATGTLTPHLTVPSGEWVTGAIAFQAGSGGVASASVGFQTIVQQAVKRASYY